MAIIGGRVIFVPRIGALQPVQGRAMREPPLVAIRIVGDSINAEIAAHPHVGEAFPHRVPAADAEHQQREDEGEGPAPADHEQSDRKRSEEHTSELQSLMRNSYAVLCLNKKNTLYHT